MEHEHRGPPRLGLVLGAGGARGLAHIGVLKVLGRHGVRFDLVVGASMGSLIGAAYAAGLSMERVEHLVLHTPLRLLLRLRPGGTGLLDPAGLEAVLRATLGGRSFADLAVPLAVVATDLASGRLVLLREGPLVPALLAAVAVPFAFPPVRLGGTWLADGGLIDGLPITVARLLGAERVVAVDADVHGVQPLRGRWIAPLAARLRDQLLHAGADPPTHGRVLGRLVGCVLERRPSDQPDVLVQPAFGWMTAHDFHRRARSIALGEAAAQQALPQILALRAPEPLCGASDGYASSVPTASVPTVAATPAGCHPR